MSMHKGKRHVAVPIAVIAACLASTALADRDRHDSKAGRKNCSAHAKLLFQACRADRQDDWLVHRADCIYVTPIQDQRSCLADALQETRDKAEECDEVYDARLEACELLGEQRFDLTLAPGDLVDPGDIGDGVEPNPYFPLTAGHTHVVVGDGEVTVVTVTDEVREVGGLPCRVVRDLVFEETENDEYEIEYEALEVTQDWYAQLQGDRLNGPGDVIYCGENTYEIEDGLIDNTDGSFANGSNRARAGFLVRALPIVGEGDRQEMASDEAEDYVKYLSLAASPSPDITAAELRCREGGRDTCLETLEVNPRDPGQAEFKYYKPGKGFVLAVKLDEDRVPTGEREEVSCVGDSIDEVLATACGIADPAALREALCLWAPGAPFCASADVEL